MMQMNQVPSEAADGSDIDVESIAVFQYSADIGFVGRWDKVLQLDRFAIRLEEKIHDSLRLAEFYNPRVLRVDLLSRGLQFTYDDEEYGFELELGEDGRVALSRGGSSMTQFRDWYRRLMPSVPGLFGDIQSTLNQEVSSTTQLNTKFEIQTLTYRFLFVAYDFIRKSDGQQTRNLHVIDSNVSNRQELLSPRPDLFDEGKYELQLSEWRRVGRTHMNQSYRVRAPSNRKWGSLWFDFSLSGDTRFPADESRVPFLAKEALVPAVNDLALEQFVEVRAIRTFMASVLHNYHFSTAPARIP